MLSIKYRDFLLENRIKIKMELPQDIYDIKAEFDKRNKKLYVVGGAVRDWLHGKKPHDIDLVTDAQPEESKSILKGKFRVSDEQGKSFGVIRVYTENEPLGYEIATFRKDISKGRDTKTAGQKVEIGKHITIEDDVRRRDLTQNALFYDIDKEEIVDLVGGVSDIEKNIISAVGDPAKRYDEDRLRILRTIRFASRNLSRIDKKTSDAILNDRRLRNISDIDDVSQERIYEEFHKMVKWCHDHNRTDSFMFYLKLLKKYHLFEEMFPEVKTNIAGIYPRSFNLSVIFAMLFRDNEPDRNFENKLSEFKIPNNAPNKILDRAFLLIRLKNDITNIDKIPELNKKRKQITLPDLTIKEFFGLLPISNNERKYVNCFLKYNPQVSGNDLKNQGIKGVEIGNMIRKKEIEEFQQLLNRYKEEEDYLE